MKIKMIVLGSAAILLLLLLLFIELRHVDSSPTVSVQAESVSETASVYKMETTEAEPTEHEESVVTEEPPISDGKRARRRLFGSERLDAARKDLFSDDLAARRRAVRIIKRRGTKEDLDAFAELVTEETDPQTQITMIRALRARETPESMQALFDCLVTDNPRVRMAAVRSLAGMKDPEARVYLENAVNSGYIESGRVGRLSNKKVVEDPTQEFTDGLE